MNFKKIAIAAAASAVMLGTMASSVFADAEDYYNNPGRLQAKEVGAQCGTGAGSGAFQYFGGKDNNLSGGANGYKTGVNNSAVCGNRQGNL